MRVLTTIISMVIFTTICIAQNSAISKADRFLKSKMYQEAIAEIEKAVVHKKTKSSTRAWYTRYDIYAKMSSDSQYSSNREEHITKALESLEKVFELTNEGDNFNELAGFGVEGLWNNAITYGTNAYSQQQYEVAISEFEIAQMIKPQDTTAYIYAGISASAIEDYSRAANYYWALVDLNYHNEDIYRMLISIEGTMNGNVDKALEVAQMAREKFPENSEIQKQEINLLIKAGKDKEAKESLVEAVEKEPNNTNLLFNLGYLYETLGEEQNAVEAYERSITADANNFDAVYNLGTHYYNKAAFLYNQAADLSEEDFQSKGESLESEAKTNLSLALPYFEKASELKAETAIIWNTLSNIYTRLGMEDKSLMAYKKYKELSGY